MSNNNRRNNTDLALILAFILAFLGIVAIFIPYEELAKALSGSKYYIDLNRFDKLGSFIGGVTAPFLSFAAFILLYKTYKSQKQELQDTRQILQSQDKTGRIQRFENTFFHMLEMHQKRVDNLPQISSSSLMHERNSEYNEKYFKSCFDFFISKNRFTHFENLIEEYEAVYNKKLRSNLSYYYRTFYRLFKSFAAPEITTLSEKDKWNYAKILRAQMSDEEIMIFLLNAHTEMGKNWRGLIKEYNLTKHILKQPCISLINSSFNFYKIDSNARVISQELIILYYDIIVELMYHRPRNVCHFMQNKNLVLGKYKNGIKLYMIDDQTNGETFRLLKKNEELWMDIFKRILNDIFWFKKFDDQFALKDLDLSFNYNKEKYTVTTEIKNNNSIILHLPTDKY